MNLFDMATRKDRALIVEEGDVAPIQRKLPQRFRGVALSKGARIRLKNAHTFTAIRQFPRAPGWSAWVDSNNGPAHLEIRLESADGRSHVLYPNPSGEVPPPSIGLDWPCWAGFVEAFDLTIQSKSSEGVQLACGWIFNPRLILAPLLRGEGIEVGPGANPFVKPDAHTAVRYVEQSGSAEDWAREYGKTLNPAELQELWSRYVIGDAAELDMIEDGSLDFIFSSHVFEHLVNPLKVLGNWARKLRPGGTVAAVIPDSRYCFDLRQPVSTVRDWTSEFDRTVHVLGLDHYQKWCRYTAPESNPEKLMARKYSVHAHYYTSDSILELIGLARDRGDYDAAFINQAPNNKDFGIALRRS